uniref:EOG090X0AGI n=1 Tax=Evadne anonyx TaxID=141404 RepID=A0A9N6WS16_9CRUS|nr:EOG090X0AGI [Evadne anonyx]
MAVSTTVRTMRDAWHYLNGIACVYKPAGVSCQQVRHTLITNLCRDINKLEQSPPRALVKIERSLISTENEIEPSYEVSTVPNLTDLALVRGPGIVNNDVRLSWSNNLGPRVSGVMVLGINRANAGLSKLKDSRPISVYQIKAQFGQATEDHWHDGKIWEKTTSAHLKKSVVDAVLSSIQATNQRNMFEYCGVNPTSQAAYELASRGLLRPGGKSPPLLYGIKCIHFEPPDFTLEIHCINANQKYLSTLVHELGLELKTTAVCLQMRCTRYGYFKVEDSLLRNQWALDDLMENMVACRDILMHVPNVTANIAAYQIPPKVQQTPNNEMN